MLTLFAAPWAFGQISGGPKAGVNFPGQYITPKLADEEIEGNQKLMVGFHVGGELLVQLPVVGLEFEANALLTRKGRLDKIGEVKHTTDLYYLDFPLKVNYSIGLAKTGIFFGAGPTLSVGLFGWDRTGDLEAKVHWGDELGAYKRFDIGVGAQVGVRIAGFQVSGYFDWFFANIRNIEGLKVTNYNGGLSLAYLF